MKHAYRFAIDAREVAGNRAGKGRYLVGLLRGLAAVSPATVEWVLYSKEPIPEDIVLPTTSRVVILPRYRLPGLRPFWLAGDLVRRHVDAFLAPTGFLPAIFSSVPTAIVVHDLAVWKAPNHPPSVILQEKGQLGLAVRRAGTIFVVSHHTGRDLTELFPRAAGKLIYAPNAADQSYHPFRATRRADQTAQARVRKAYHLPANFLLFVGTLEPRKNLPRLIEAYHAVPVKLKDAYPLLVVGKKGWGFAEIFARVTALHESEAIRFLGYVPDEDLPALYASATAAVYPSLYEGFGLPPVEALACGTPLLTSNTSSLPEVVGDAALTVDPTDTLAITRALARLVTDVNLRTALRRAGPNQAHQFTWEKTAQIVLDGLIALASTKSDQVARIDAKSAAD